MEKTENQSYDYLLNSIASTYTFGKTKAFKAVNTILIETYWRIGHRIVEFEQGGNSKAEYGNKLLERLSKDLSLSYGKGFSLSNIKRFRQFYLVYPDFSIGAEAPHQLSWSHFIELLKIESSLERREK